MSQIKRNTSKKLLNTIQLQNKNSLYQHAHVLPLFVTNCQRAIMTHHQKVEVEQNVQHSPNRLIKSEAQQVHPPKFVHAPPKRLGLCPAYSVEKHRSKKKVEDQQQRQDRHTPQQQGHQMQEAQMLLQKTRLQGVQSQLSSELLFAEEMWHLWEQ